VAAVVLSRRAFNEEHDHSIRAMISTAARSHWPSDIPIADTAAAGLPRGCVVRWKLFTLPNPVILRRAGALAKNDYGTVLATARTIVF
jgi:mRNA interferase MazF